MAYVVTVMFHDLSDYEETKGGRIYHQYNVGDAFPRKGKDVSEDRINELAGSENARGIPLIKEVVSEEAPAEEVPAEEVPAEEAPKKRRRKAVKDVADNS